MKKLVLLSLVGLLIWMLPQATFSQAHPGNEPSWAPLPEPVYNLRADPEIFLQGNYVEVGIHQVGSFGTAGNAAAGFHPLNYTPSDRRLGFVADPGKDGWASNASDPTLPNQSGDYFVPGAPEENFSIEFDYLGNEYNFQNAGLQGTNYPIESGIYVGEIPQTSLVNTSSGSTNSCEWTGTATHLGQSLLVQQEVTFDDEDLFFVVNIALTNTGPNALQNVEYLRSFDPDQGGPIACATPQTYNFVVHQPGSPGSGDTALVVAETGPECGSIPGAYYAIDPLAVVSTESFYVRDPDEVLDSPTTYPPGAPNYADQAISIAWRYAEVAPGETVNLQFAIILNEGDLDDPGNVLPPSIPLSDYAVFLALGLMIIFAATIIRFRRMA